MANDRFPNCVGDEKSEVRLFIQRIEQLAFEHKDTKVSVQIGEALEKVAEVLREPKRKVGLAAPSAISRSSATVCPTLATTKAEEAKRLRDSMSHDLGILEQLTKLSVKNLRAAVEDRKVVGKGSQRKIGFVRNQRPGWVSALGDI
jgi:hypothetical protein